MKVIEEEPFPSNCTLSRVIVVASDCAPELLETLRSFAAADPRIHVLEQEQRRGKADAINQVIRSSDGELLVLVNADALPAPGAVSKLLMRISADRQTGVISANPQIEPGSGISHDILTLMWETHNEASHDLNDMRVSNHCSDELMVVRSEALDELPAGLVNDGAFIAGTAYSRGFRVRFLESAPVNVQVPKRIPDVIKQRRRILYGHLQVWKILGTAPRTAESLMIKSPRLGSALVGRTLAKKPRLIAALPFALVCEAVSLIGAIFDFKFAGNRHAVWERVGD